MSYKIGIIGCGNVGASYAFSLINQALDIREIILIDINNTKAKGIALDLSHSLAFSRSYMNIIRVGEYSDLDDTDILCITAGVPQNSKKVSRMEDIYKARVIIDNIMSEVLKTKFDGIILVASNPLDVMTQRVGMLYGKYNKVIGSGTLLETARMKYYISSKLGFPIKSISGYVFGEHGDSQFITWSSVKINKKYDIKEYLTIKDMLEIEESVKHAGMEVSSMQGFTCYGVANALTCITKTIIENNIEDLILACTFDEDKGVYISNLSSIGKDGVKKNMLYKFIGKEEELYDISCNIVKDAYSSL